MKPRQVVFLIFIFVFITNIFAERQIEKTIELLNNAKYDEAIKLLETDGEQNDILLAIAYLGKKEFNTAKIFALQYWLKNENDILVNYILAFICEELKDYDAATMYWNFVYKNAKNSSIKNLAKKHIEVLKKISK